MARILLSTKSRSWGAVAPRVIRRALNLPDDPAFRRELLREGIECFLSGDMDTGKTVLRDFINATVGFTKLAKATHRSPKSLMRMFGLAGNPHAHNLFEIVAFLQRQERVRLKVRSSSAVA